jgi:hypothetical protein
MNWPKSLSSLSHKLLTLKREEPKSLGMCGSLRGGGGEIRPAEGWPFARHDTREFESHWACVARFVAEEVRFELTIGLPLCQFSRLVPSTARPLLLKLKA